MQPVGKISPDMPIGQPLILRSETLPNRIAKAAMTEGLADQDALPSEKLVRLYELWANGGAGLLITGNSAIDADHLERPGNVIVNRQAAHQSIDSYRRWTSAARHRGAGIWMQLNHAGRQTPSLVNPSPLAPSPVPLNLPGKQFGRPRAMTEAQVLQAISAFAEASAIARDGGFTGVQIHAAHGFLVSQFLSPLSNRRTDAWGGSLENRARFLLEIVRAARVAAGHDFTLSVKLNSADFQRGGFTSADSMTVAQWLEAHGVDVVEISGGNYQQPRMMNMPGLKPPDLDDPILKRTVRDSYFLGYSNALIAKVTIPIMVTGGFRSLAAMNDAVGKEGVSLIGLARPLVLDPNVPAKLLDGAMELERCEEGLRIGPGWLGPGSPSALVRAVNGFGALYWQYQQLRRLAEGRNPDRALGLLSALLHERRDQRRWMRNKRQM